MIKHINKKKNESFDLSSDIHNWLNDYCVNLMNSGATIEDIKVELSNLDYTELADDVILDLSLDEDDRDLVEYDLERFASDFLDYIETGRKDSHFDKNLSDWLDKYKNNTEYSASLESNTRNNTDKKLEARIRRLEKMLNRKSVKNEISSREYAIRNDIDVAAGEVKKATLKLYRILEMFGNDDLMSLFNKLSSAADEMLMATGEILHEDIDD